MIKMREWAEFSPRTNQDNMVEFCRVAVVEAVRSLQLQQCWTWWFGFCNWLDVGMHL